MGEQRNSLLRQELIKIGIDPTDEEIVFHAKVGNGKRILVRGKILEAEKWFFKLLEANHISHHYDSDGITNALSFAWHRLCSNSGNLGLWVWKRWKSSSWFWAEDPQYNVDAKKVWKGKIEKTMKEVGSGLDLGQQLNGVNYEKGCQVRGYTSPYDVSRNKGVRATHFTSV